METPETMPFVCERCGACCRCMELVAECAFLSNGKGSCKYYSDEKKECIIYDFRPEICNVTKMYYKRFKDKMTWEEYINKSHKACQSIRDYEKKRNIKR